MIDTARIITTHEALCIVTEIVGASRIVGLRPLEHEIRGDSLHLEFKRAWTINCSLSISFGGGMRTAVRGRGRRATPEEYVWVQAPRVEVCWSSTGRSVAGAHAALALYREVVELAALVEARLAEETVAWREDARAQEPAAPTAEGGSR